MSEVMQIWDVSSSTDRRKHLRQRPRSLAYAELDQENGGIVLDASESGISVHAVVALTENELPRLRLKLPDATTWLEAPARVVWKLDTGKVAGLQFEDLPDAAREQIREWLSKETLTSQADSDYPPAPTEQPGAKSPETEQPSAGLIKEAVAAPVAPSKGGISTPHSQNVAAPVRPLREESASHPATVVHSETVVVTEAPAAEARGVAAVAKSAANRSRPTDESPSAVSKILSDTRHSPAPIYLLFVVLALVSLTAGWAAGRGKFASISQGVQNFFARAGASSSVALAADEQLPPTVKDIEVVDVNNQRRTIPLVADSIEPTPVTPKVAAPDQAPQSTAKKSGMGFQLWTLSPPQRSAAAGNADKIANAAPPAVDTPNSVANVVPLASAAIEPPSPDRLPKPTNATGVLKRGALLKRVEPEYPEFARQQNISGTVTIEATVGVDGRVESVRVVSGPKLLVQAAINAVRQWRYSPTLLDGKAIETEVVISLEFHLPNNGQ